MNEDTVDRTNELLHALDDEEIQSAVDQTIMEDPMKALRTEILGFFKSHINLVSQQERLRSKIQTALEELVDERSLEFNQLLQMYNTVSTKEIASADAIISIFKPVPGATSLLAANVSESQKSEDQYSEAFDQMSPDDVQILDKLFRALRQIKEENTSE